ncbi:MAG: hypothetical protein ACP5I3_09950 [Thermoproteus sp.]
MDAFLKMGERKAQIVVYPNWCPQLYLKLAELKNCGLYVEYLSRDEVVVKFGDCRGPYVLKATAFKRSLGAEDGLYSCIYYGDHLRCKKIGVI